MFDQETVFILGAGASWHYGYPTGEELVKRVIEKAKEIEKFIDDVIEFINGGYTCFPTCLSKIGNFSDDAQQSERVRQVAAWNVVKQKCHDLAKHLSYVNPVVIDNFLGQNPSLRDIGKMMIAWVILECEAWYYAPHIMRGDADKSGNATKEGLSAKEKRYNINHRSLLENSPHKSKQEEAKTIDITKFKDDWCRFVLHRLAQYPDKLHENKVTFVTFNYDASLERSLYKGLEKIEAFKNSKINVSEFINTNRFLHVYGRVHDNYAEKQVTLEKLGVCPKKILSPPQYYSYQERLFDTVCACSNDRIFTIDDYDQVNGDKNKLDAVKEKARKEIEGAKYIYILGYGFDDRNSNRLNLIQSIQNQNERRRKIYFTNFGDRNFINKKASQIFLSRYDGFLPPAYIRDTLSSTDGFQRSNKNYYEKSTRNVYEALEMDFDFL